ncbi:type II asparaginase [Chishuiella sp.]|uniref:type II asparaginase n=1 Tax=Chishuiella sp. TaxID=1969467 RepID=UPI0028B075B0|nr:type II asparaginase [Chishuiella sp.]
MRKIQQVLFAFLFIIQIHGQVTNENKARIIILATGGTIAGSGESSTKSAYTAGKVPIDNLLNAVPEMYKYADIKGEQIAQIGSQDMNIETWLKLSNRINQIFENNEADGVVVTHGTDTQEETAYFLSLTINSKKPVVLVGAMRPATAMSQDGNKNLLDAVMVASSPESKEIGVVTAMNEEIFAARDVTKTITTSTATFQSRNFGPIGLIYDGKVSYYYKTLRNPAKKFNVKELKTLPLVEIIYGYADAKPSAIIAAQKDRAVGIVYAGMGNGNFNAPVGKALESASKDGIIICRSSRTGGGRVTLYNEVDDKALGFIVADDLNPQKARILLMLALTETKDKTKIQDMFFNY